jgi:hypothetical protein
MKNIVIEARERLANSSLPPELRHRKDSQNVASQCSGTPGKSREQVGQSAEHEWMPPELEFLTVRRVRSTNAIKRLVRKFLDWVYS